MTTNSLRMSELVLRTARFEEMMEWYQHLLERDPFLQRTPSTPAGPVGGQERAADVRVAFFTVHEDHPFLQTLAIFEILSVARTPAAGPGMHHFQFRVASIDPLLEQYDRLTALGTRPHRIANHGMATSFYYRDPDRNIIELSCPNFGSWEEETAYYGSERFSADPSGIEIDPAEFAKAIVGGSSRLELLHLPRPS
jgi:catechol 2,3-dioxygenase-like lactoylglutathione lyase family enzyme